METSLPGRADQLRRSHPELWDAYTRLGAACGKAGPLAGREVRLVKLALAAGAGLEGGLHSHVRRALAEGMEPDEIRHVALLGVTTLGFPSAVAVLSWIEDVLNETP